MRYQHAGGAPGGGGAAAASWRGAALLVAGALLLLWLPRGPHAPPPLLEERLPAAAATAGGGGGVAAAGAGASAGAPVPVPAAGVAKRGDAKPKGRSDQPTYEVRRALLQEGGCGPVARRRAAVLACAPAAHPRPRGLPRRGPQMFGETEVLFQLPKQPAGAARARPLGPHLTAPCGRRRSRSSPRPPPPPPPSKHRAPAGVLFVAHGCGHAALDWFPQSKACPRCVGLPEEMNITAAALARRLALVAVSSAARDSHQCWDAYEGSDDIVAVGAVCRGLRGWGAAGGCERGSNLQRVHPVPSFNLRPPGPARR
jgi:hypothetical protein